MNSLLPARLLRRLLLAGLSLLGALLFAALGWGLVRASIDEPRDAQARPVFGWWTASLAGSLARLSYDLPFLVRGPRPVPPARIVYLDERSAGRLGQTGDLWDRRLHGALVRRLTREGARAIFFDIVFRDPSPDPAADAEFATAIAEHGRVFLAAALEPDVSPGASGERTFAPPPVLRGSAAGWGLITFRPLDPDYGVRRMDAGTEQVPSATWRAAVALGAALPDTLEARSQGRWLNYYGPADSFPNASYDRALAEDELPPGFFRDQLVFVGGRSTLGSILLGKDDFFTPYGRVGDQFAHGVELHATILLNLLRGEWLTRLAPARELWLVLACGALLGGALPWLRPHWAAIATVLAVAATVAAACWLHTQRQTWLAWCVPVLVQAPLALGWAVGARYFVEERRRHALREAFARYLSPQMADRIAAADFDLKPGGTVVEATVMFTDLENFAVLAERLDQPERIGKVLTTYFTHTTGHILGNDGTILKYMGDSVEAVWGAPLPDAAQARKAVQAAWQLHLASQLECEGHPLRTRIGINTGRMLAGNLGSAQRFDFAVTGDEVNFASRLEGLNKYLGTDILIAESVCAQLGGAFITRDLGEFLVVGKKVPRRIHELLGPADGAAPRPWLETFARALAAWQHGDLDAAERSLRETIAQRGTPDGPAAFFLERIAALRTAGLPPGWRGVVEFDTK